MEKLEREPKDVSSEFLNMSVFEFKDFLKTQKNEPSLSITINWKDILTARRLKAFLEDFSALGKQKRYAAIKATEEQMQTEMNVFSSGVKWIRVEK